MSSLSLGNQSISYFRLERNARLRPPVILLVRRFSIDYFTNYVKSTLIYTNRMNHAIFDYFLIF